MVILVIAGVFSCAVTPLVFAIPHIPAVRRWREDRAASRTSRTEPAAS